jgi:hypothetical protein
MPGFRIEILQQSPASDNTITKEPEHGTATIDVSEHFPNFSKDNIRAKCNEKAVHPCRCFWVKELIEPVAWKRCEIVNKAEQDSLRGILEKWGARS